MKQLRGYFGIGVESLSKPMNLGALQRTAHAFGASFTFSVAAAPKIRVMHNSDTAKSDLHVPWYLWGSVAEMQLPKGCQLVGVELTDDAIDLPSFRHPLQAAYVMGGEARDLSPEMQAKCAHIVRIPTRFCINVALAGALVMYDRTLTFGGYPARPVAPGGPPKED
ncbi:MAG: RNA methyltransferase [Hyphomonadaceae bacterium]|nr:RNA methyltransferase [Hyphomonadaceae bacterium]